MIGRQNADIADTLH